MTSIPAHFWTALRDALAPAQRRALLTSVVAAFLIFLALHAAVAWGIDEFRPERFPWLKWPLEILGSFAVLGLAWLLFPAVSTTILSFYLDGVLDRLERQHYPALGPALRVPISAVLRSGLRLLILTIALNLLALPIYLAIPAINLVLFYLLNGYLLSREYFDLVALRRLDGVAARTLWRERRGRWLVAGMAIAALLSLPIANLAAPLVAAALMLHLVTEAAGLAAGGALAERKTLQQGEG